MSKRISRRDFEQLTLIELKEKFKDVLYKKEVPWICPHCNREYTRLGILWHYIFFVNTRIYNNRPREIIKSQSN